MNHRKLATRTTLFVFSFIALASVLSTNLDMAQPLLSIKTNPDEVIGIWVSEAQDSKMEIYKSGNTYSGRLLAGWGNTFYEKDGKILKKDSKNPDSTLRNCPLLNMKFITDLRYKDGEYTGGTLYVAQLGRTVSCKIKFNQRTLVMRAYVGFPLLGMTKKWTKVKSVQ